MSCYEFNVRYDIKNQDAFEATDKFYQKKSQWLFSCIILSHSRQCSLLNWYNAYNVRNRYWSLTFSWQNYCTFRHHSLIIRIFKFRSMENRKISRHFRTIYRNIATSAFVTNVHHCVNVCNYDFHTITDASLQIDVL